MSDVIIDKVDERELSNNYKLVLHYVTTLSKQLLCCMTELKVKLVLLMKLQQATTLSMMKMTSL